MAQGPRHRADGSGVSQVARTRTAPGGAPARDGLIRAVALALVVVGSVLVLQGLVGFARDGSASITRVDPLDLDLNLVAARRLARRAPLYDATASRRDAVAMAGPDMSDRYTTLTNGFPGSPVTALVHEPFLLFGHHTGVDLFRTLDAIGMVAAVVVTSRTLPPGRRAPGLVLGIGALVGSFAFFHTLSLGQEHQYVMLGLAIGLWGVARERWRVAGVGFGIATVLKISPVAALVYLLARGKREAIAPAVATAAALSLAAAALGRPLDWVVWARDVAPSLSGGVIRSANQSLPAYLARLTATSGDLSRDASIGAWRFIALPMVALALAWLARRFRGRHVDPLELGAMVLVGLLAGPLSWGHYAVWAALPVVLLGDLGRWRRLGTVAAGATTAAIASALVLLTILPAEPASATLAQRLASGPTTLAVLLLLVAAVVLLGPEVAAPEAAGDAGAQQRVLTPATAGDQADAVLAASVARSGA